MRKIGLHLRLQSSLPELIQDAVALQVPLFQCFLVTQAGFFIELSEVEIEQVQASMQQFEYRFLHASYWSNLSSVKFTKHRVLMKELDLAKRLGFTHVVIHPGSAKGARYRTQGIDALARTLNPLLSHEDSVRIVLENTAHGDMSIGGSFEDFKLLLEKVDRPDNLFFCVDTAHAYSYGYNIVTAEGREHFIKELQETITLNKIVLIHLNDTYDRLGSHLDRHAVPGEGKIGDEALKSIILDTRLCPIPLLLEPPALSMTQQKALLQKITNWHIPQ